jgi:integrase
MIRWARQFFRAAQRDKLINTNPFAELKSNNAVDLSRRVFVRREVIERVIAACPDSEWRAIIALARYGGLRCPSEVLALRWQDIDWERFRFRVPSPKTGERWVPLFPELRPYLEELFKLAEPGATYVIARHRNPTAWRYQFAQIIERAGERP